MADSEFIPTSEPVLDGNELKYLTEAIKVNNWISANGPFTQKFEKEFAKWVGKKYGVACSNGTTAIHLAVTSLGLGPGDEIIIPDFTIMCSASMPILSGVKPVLVDVDKYWCMDPTKIEEKITRKTRAIMPVHMYGNPANMEAILKIAKKHNLYVIEDACAAHGATVGGKKVGSMGDVGCFSFYASKNITSGEGGMIVTDDENVANMARILRSQGFEKPRFIHRYIGFNYRLTDIQAAVAYAQFEKIDKKIKRRQEIARHYQKLLKNVPEIEIMQSPPWGKSTFWMFGVLIKESFGRTRDEVMALLNEKGVGTDLFYLSMSLQPVFKNGKNPLYPDISRKYPVSQDVALRGFYLPSGLGITKSQQERVVKILLSLRVRGARIIRPTYKREDERGVFNEILNGSEWKNISLGSMKKGAVMGNHFHKKTKVFFFLTSGSAKVDLIDVKTKETQRIDIEKGSGVILEPKYSHAIRFAENSDFVMGKSIEYSNSESDTYPHIVPVVQ